MNSKLKKIISVSLAMIVLVMSVGSDNIKAEVIDEVTENNDNINSTNADEGIAPYYNFIMSNFVALDITGNNAESDVEVIASQANVKSISVHLTLQRKLSGTNNWTNVASWSRKVNDSDILFGENKILTVHGTYRAVSDIYVYDNNNGCESDVNYSKSHTY